MSGGPTESVANSKGRGPSGSVFDSNGEGDQGNHKRGMHWAYHKGGRISG